MYNFAPLAEDCLGISIISNYRFVGERIEQWLRSLDGEVLSMLRRLLKGKAAARDYGELRAYLLLVEEFARDFGYVEAEFTPASDRLGLCVFCDSVPCEVSDGDVFA